MSVFWHTLIAFSSIFVSFWVGYYMGVQKMLWAYKSGYLRKFFSQKSEVSTRDEKKDDR